MVKRLLYPLCLLMAIVIVLVSIPTISFSWFEPDTKEGIGLEFKDDTKLRAQDCSIQTFEGGLGNKLVNYGSVPVANAKVTINEGEVKYYKTVITNTSTDYDTVVSLFLSSLELSSAKVSLCVSNPTNSCRVFTTNQSDIHIIRNAYVKKNVSTDANPGQLIVEWFVKCESGSVSFNPSTAYLMYS